MLSRTLAAQYQVISREQALKCGLPRSTVTTWCKPNKKWQKLLHNIAPARVQNDWDNVCQEIRSSLDQGRKRPRLPIVAFDPVG
jgi:hypothetical protein